MAFLYFLILFSRISFDEYGYERRVNVLATLGLKTMLTEMTLKHVEQLLYNFCFDEAFLEDLNSFRIWNRIHDVNAN